MSEKKIPEPLEALVIILFSIFFIYLFNYFISELFFPQKKPEENIQLFYVISGIIFFILPFIYLKKKNYNLKLVFRLNPVSREVLLLSLFIAVTLTIISNELDRLIQILIPVPDWVTDHIQYLLAQSPLEWILIILGAIIIASFAEEILFRGFLQVSLENKGDVTRAVILSSVAWTIVHLNPYWAIQIFIMGVIIGFLAWRTNSVIPSIIVHATNNLIALLFLNFELDRRLKWYLLGDHVSPILLGISLYILIWSIRKLTNLYKKQY